MRGFEFVKSGAHEAPVGVEGLPGVGPANRQRAGSAQRVEDGGAAIPPFEP